MGGGTSKAVLTGQDSPVDKRSQSQPQISFDDELEEESKLDTVSPKKNRSIVLVKEKRSRRISPSKILRSDSLEVTTKRRESLLGLITPKKEPKSPSRLTRSDSMEIIANEQRRRRSSTSGGGSFDSTGSNNNSLPRVSVPSPLVRQDSINVTKERRKSGSDNLDSNKHKLAAINAGHKKKRASDPTTGYSRSEGGRSRSGSLNSNDHAQTHIDLRCPIDPTEAAMLEATRAARLAYEQAPLSPEDKDTRSTRRGSLCTSHIPNQEEAHHRMASRLDPIYSQNEELCEKPAKPISALVIKSEANRSHIPFPSLEHSIEMPSPTMRTQTV